MRNRIFLIMATLVFWSCTKERPLVFLNETYEGFSQTQNESEPTKVVIDIPIATPKNTVSDSINLALYNFIKDVIYLDEKPGVFSSYEELTTSFISSYEELKSKYPEEIEWEANIKGEIVFQTEKLLNIKLEYYVFTGGAHGYFGVKSFIFDIPSGRQLTKQDLFADLENFTLLVENKFRNKFQIDLTQNINSTGFMFENDSFHLSENIFITEDSILLVYNTYEIASYADGIQELIIPLDEVQTFLKFDIAD